MSKKIQRPEGMGEQIKNYNFEEKSWFTRGYQMALEQKNLILQKLEGKIKTKNQRHKAIKYEIDSSIVDYSAWREFEKNSNPQSEMIMMVNYARLNISPAELVKAWGLPNYRTDHKKYNLGLFYFEDCELGKYMIYDVQEEDSQFYKMWKSEGYYKAFDEFFKSEQPHSFRVQSLRYDDKLKFMHFLKKRIKQVASGEALPYFEQTEKVCGKINNFNDFNLKFSDEELPIVFTQNRTKLNPLLQNPKNLEFIKDEEFNKIPQKLARPKIQIIDEYQPFILSWKLFSCFRMRIRLFDSHLRV